jgi:hypothetical protein
MGDRLVERLASRIELRADDDQPQRTRLGGDVLGREDRGQCSAIAAAAIGRRLN